MRRTGKAFGRGYKMGIRDSYEIQWQLTKINDYTKMNAMYGAQNYTYKNWATSAEAYTTEQYNGFKSEAEGK